MEEIVRMYCAATVWQATGFLTLRCRFEAIRESLSQCGGFCCCINCRKIAFSLIDRVVSVIACLQHLGIYTVQASRARSGGDGPFCYWQLRALRLGCALPC